MTYGQLFMRMNPNVKVVENGTCVWIFFDEVNHDTMRKGWWDKEIPDDANDAGWISVKDRLPDEQGIYLVFREEPYGMITIAWYSGHENGWLALDGGFYADEVLTHYMPLPEPPKEG